MRFLFLTLSATSLTLSQETLEPMVVIGERTREILPNETAWDDFEIQQFAPQTIDALLATAPSFSLYRRQSALFGNPTSSGVSLRNIGATAAARSLVLFDGIPQNDPFGGWVNWARYDPALLDRVRLSSSSQSSTWGNLSVGGSVQFTSKTIKDGQGSLTLSGVRVIWLEAFFRISSPMMNGGVSGSVLTAAKVMATSFSKKPSAVRSIEGPIWKQGEPFFRPNGHSMTTSRFNPTSHGLMRRGGMAPLLLEIRPRLLIIVSESSASIMI